MSLETLVEASSVEGPAPAPTAGLVRAAGVISLGNVLSRVLGLARETVIADLFGASPTVSLFRVAATLIQTLYDFLVGGMVSAALIPVFSEYADRPGELWRLASILFSALACLLAAAVLVLELLAPQVFILLGVGYDPALQAAGTDMIRLILPALLFLGLSGLVSGLLYSLKRFTYPAFTTATYNAAIILVAVLLSARFGIYSLILGILVGAAAQVALQLPGLRDAEWHWSLNLRHPALREILVLYAPVLGGLAIMVVGVAIDRNLASRTGAQSLAWMQAATVLYQFPLGLVATAVSFAILPSLSRAGSAAEFRQTLALGLKLVLLLILPATVGLFLLARPIIALLFEHGAFTVADTTSTARALQVYLIGLPFAAVDQPLVFAFYARKNTLAPNLVQLLGVGAYLAVALPLMQPFGMLGLVLANSAQLTMHSVAMLYLAGSRLGGLRGLGLGPAVLKTSAVALLIGAAIVLASVWSLEGAGLVAKLMRVLLPGTAALLMFVAGSKILRVREADELWRVVTSRIGSRRGG